MSRKRIILCLDQPIDRDPVAKFVSRYFDNNHRIVRLNITAEKPYAKKLASVNNAQAGHSIANLPGHFACSVNEYVELDTIFKQICREARFSDLLIIGEAYYHWLCRWNECQEESAEKFIFPHCPKLIVPLQEESIDQIIIVDDGHPETHYQIKYLSCMFSELCTSIPTVLLTFQDDRNDMSVKEEKLWIDYLKIHFAELAVHRIEQRSNDILMFTNEFSGNVLLMGSWAASTALTNALSPLGQFRLTY